MVVLIEVEVPPVPDEVSVITLPSGSLAEGVTLPTGDPWRYQEALAIGPTEAKVSIISTVTDVAEAKAVIEALPEPDLISRPTYPLSITEDEKVAVTPVPDTALSVKVPAG